MLFDGVVCVRIAGVHDFVTEDLEIGVEGGTVGVVVVVLVP